MDLRADVADDEGRLGKINWTLRTFMIDELTDYYKNPRSLSDKEFKQLKTSLDKFGMIDKPIVNLDSANTIIGGHQRKHVLESTGAKEIECWTPDRLLTDKEVEELNIRLNKNTGSWDFDTLANEFQLDDLLDWGFDKGELDLDLWADEAPEDVEPQIDKAEELRVKWGVESGQLWQLGEHRLVCGDCTDKAVVEKVMQGERADCGFSDPPYGISYKSGTWSKEREATLKELKNDDLQGEDLSEFLQSFYQLQREVTDGDIYVCCDWKSYPNFKDALTPIDKLTNLIVWDKRFQTQALNTFAFTHEFILFFGDNGGPYKDTNVWTVDREFNKFHPTVKPVELVEKALEYSSKNIVTDFFSGSGTTLIACERLGRKCRAVEISPAYVAVAIQRWVDVTGGEPVLLGS